ncbi:formin-1-like [Spea bombifrons]|uniref:formin-1-like n=1 Tax=Spea bombifrons TaxID=233779 RepID=UPI00234A5DBD|nr:formin-1-like [Spea bombifrons]
MESTHSVLQLHKPIMELCYVSFYLPGGSVRGFTYKRCVTRDKARTCFDSCYRIKEETEAAEHRDPPYESFTEALKETTTQNILTELYKLTAAKNRLLVHLLQASRNPKLRMGNQEGKFQDLPPGSSIPEEDVSGRMDFHESWSASNEKKVSSSKVKKNRRFSRRKESIEDFVQKKTKWKGGPEAGAMHTRDKAFAARPSLTNSVDSLSRPRLQSVENKESYTTGSSINSMQGKLCESSGMLGTESAMGSSLSVYDNDVFDDFSLLPHSDSLLGDLQGVMKIMQEQNSAPMIQGSKAERRCTEYNNSEEPGSRRGSRTVVAKVQDISPCVQRVVTSFSYPENSAEDARCENVTTVVSAVPNEFISQADVLKLCDPPDRDPQSLRGSETDQEVDRASERHLVLPLNDGALVSHGFVNKSLIRVLQSDSVEETEYWLGQLDHKGDRAAVCPNLLKQATKSLNPAKFVHQSTNIKAEEKHPASLSFTCDVLNESSQPSNIIKRNSISPSPLSSRLPSPQLHHRILPLSTKLSEDITDLPQRDVQWDAPCDKSSSCQALGTKTKDPTWSEYLASDEQRQNQSTTVKYSTLQPDLPPPGGGVTQRDTFATSPGFQSCVNEDISCVGDARPVTNRDKPGKPDRNVLHLSLEILKSFHNAEENDFTLFSAERIRLPACLQSKEVIFSIAGFAIL